MTEVPFIRSCLPWVLPYAGIVSLALCTACGDGAGTEPGAAGSGASSAASGFNVWHAPSHWYEGGSADYPAEDAVMRSDWFRYWAYP